MSWAIAAGYKTIENRPWKPHAGVTHVAIHAGKTWHEPHREQMIELLGIDCPPKSDHVLGAVLATARIVGWVHEDGRHAIRPPYRGQDDWSTSRGRLAAVDSPWFSGPFGWLLDEVTPLMEPIPCKGALGLWKLPVDVHRAIAVEAAAEWWLRQLRAWDRYGVFKRFTEAIRTRRPVKVRRSSGAIDGAFIRGTGYGGRSVELEIDTSPARYKSVDTDKFLELNPELGPHLLHLRPPHA